ncbi:cytochrome c [Bacillus sp. RG28]|jgi:cytochrome c550|uniref:Cytochrome c n=1 Tax=Gottfriedia endophytica TaxID=2820819 RepID=A0A940SIA3_9BACI|nr:cytochrome c [Gottfriedia endophytica]MBP0723574.1 cytochrome c [Gottfriedia endophytica]
MKRNPLIPFALIAAIGIVLIIILGFKGVDQKKEIAAAKDGGKKTTETASAKPEDIYKNTCIGCHGDQMQGGVGPNLQKIGGQLSQDEIKNILQNGKTGKIGTMPKGLLPAEQVDVMAKWLASKK